jgi:tRNA1(Val) A37 N6-methylase TrmN6
MADAVTYDAFLGGKVQAWQPAKGFRSGVDAVLLAAAVPAKTGQSVLDLGCGVGVAGLCLAARVRGVQVTGVEIQTEYVALAARNGLDVVTADLRVLPDELRQRQFDHVMSNPPYFSRAKGTAATDDGRDLALSGETSMQDWIDVAMRRLAPKGYLTLIQHMTRLPEVLHALSKRQVAITVRPIVARPGRAPTLFLLQARNSGRAPFVMAPALLMHCDPVHPGDQESYTPAVQSILRDGWALDVAL